MSLDSNSEPNSEQLALQRLRDLRPLLLQLHKTLMEEARLAYEKNYGPILSKGDYFRLVLDNDWFSWLRPFSQFIVRIDERMASKQPEEAEKAEVLILAARQLLSPTSADATQAHPYYQLMQQNPEIAMMHAEAMGLLNIPNAVHPS